MLRLNVFGLRAARGACLRMPVATSAPLLLSVRRDMVSLPQLRLMSSAAKPKFDPTASAEPTRDGNVASRGPISWATLALFLAVGAGAIVYYNIQRAQRKVESTRRVESVGKPALGGPWSLVDSAGRPVTSGDLHGQFYLLYFGFTYCPDICPNELVKMAKVVDAVAAKAKASGLPGVLPVFVTLDPYRDTCAQVGTYVKDFHPRMLGLTGTPAQVGRIAKAFRVYFQEVDHEEGSEDYLVDHSIVMYLIGPDGDFLDFYVQQAMAPEITDRIVSTIASMQPPKPSLPERFIRMLGFGSQEEPERKPARKVAHAATATAAAPPVAAPTATSAAAVAAASNGPASAAPVKA